MKSIGFLNQGSIKNFLLKVFDSDSYINQNLNRTFILIYAKAWDNIKVKIRHKYCKIMRGKFFAIIRYIRIN